ncbi:IS5 family transposase [Sporolactobacillus terrae]|uniref:IS5 family transposase n=1 Tax=Sporolactobacillus terrae TaxID=269673 RepID=UPI00048FEC74|nr:IS5 family transposase [Sporolactobacillus terrae]
MYKFKENQLIMPEDFFLPFGGTLNRENRWVQLAQLIPWQKIEERYASTFKKATAKGTKPFSAHIAVGALILQQRQGITDRETVQQITENPYMQYFLGLEAFQERPLFHHSMMTRFRKRLKAKDINQINEWVLSSEQKQKADEKEDDPQDPKPPSGLPENQEADKETAKEPENHGKLLLDATCTPADIAYPTDVSLLDQARQKLEQIIDALYQPIQKSLKRKPRTYRNKAHKAYLAIAKQRRPGASKRRKAVGRQLRFVSRDLTIIQKLMAKSSLTLLPAAHYRLLLIISELYRQQQWMYDHRKNRIEDRIVSLSQPHVRPIVRGKAKATVEFGAKVAISLVNGDVRMEQLDWDNFNEGLTLKGSVETYLQRYGYYPEAVLADTLYRNRDNLAYCKLHHIRLSGPRLGRRTKDEQIRKMDQEIAQLDFKGRIPVEGKFGEGKRRYGLSRIYTTLRATSETVIALQFLVMNLERRLRVFLSIFYHFTFFQRIQAHFDSIRVA